MTWNRLYLLGKNSTQRRGGSCSETLASWERSELSLAFSDDDGKTWSDPLVIARHKDTTKRVSYPRILERRPGELWITTMQDGGLPQARVGESLLSTALRTSSGPAGSTAGRCNVKALPCPGVLLTVIRPPMAAIASCTKLKPSPAPSI